MKALLIYIFCAVALTPLVLEHAPQCSLQAQPAPPSLYLPDDGAEGEPINTYLEWVSTGSVTFRVQVATDAQFSNTVVDDSGLSQTYYYAGPLEHSTVYYWRVAAKDGQGQFAWSVVWTFTTMVGTPALVFPPNNDRLVSDPITMRWDTVRAAVYYYLQVAYDSTFSNLVIDEPDVSTNSFVFANPYPYSRYYWRVRAEGACCEGDWSLVWTFLLDSGPDNIAPPNNAANVPIPTQFEWTQIDGGYIHELAVSDDPGFKKLAVSVDTLTVPRYTATGLFYGKTYHWRARSWMGQTWSGWSQAWSFTTPNPPIDTVVLRSPQDQAIGVNPSPALVWESASGAATYRMQLALDPSFGSPVEDVSNLGVTSYQANGLLKGTRYFWRVRGEASFGNGAWSQTWSFVTGGVVPVLESPADGEQFVALPPVLKWRPGPGALSYAVQVALDPSFIAIVLDTTVDAPDVSAVVDGLEYGKQYYWRVNATDAGATSDWSLSWMFSTPPEGPELVSPLNGSPEPSPDVTLEWLAAFQAVGYAVQVSEDPAFSSLAAQKLDVTSLQWRPPGLQTDKTYYWRVRSLHTGGESDWSRVWYFTIGKPAPVLIAPKNNSTGVSMPVELGWQAYNGATSYRVQVARDGSFNDIVHDQNNLPDVTYQADGLEVFTGYYWRILATTPTGDSPWSETWNFTTEVGMPELDAPANNATNLPLTVELQWKPYSRATSYRVEVATDDQFANVVDTRQGIPGLIHTVAGLQRLTAYYWRVMADASFGSSGWSEVWKFTTRDIVPVLLAPANGARYVALDPVLKWRGTPGTVSHRIQVSLTPAFSATEFDQQVNGSINEIAAAGLDNGAQYYWRVNAADAAGPSDWSETWSFSTPPLGPALAAPPNGAQQLTTNVTLQWLPAAGANSYRLQLAADPGFSSIVAQQSGIAGTNWQPAGVELDKTYYWHAQAVFADGESVWSDTWTFSTGKPIPVLSSPSNGATDLPPAVDFVWLPYAGAQSYLIQIARDDSFTDIVEDESNIAGLTHAVDGLAGLTTYYWRVMAATSTGNSPWSETWKLTTATQIPSLAAPPDAATGLSVPVALQWNAVTGANSYEIELATDNAFSNVVFTLGSETGTSANATGLGASVTHYWRVRANFSFGPGPWSSVRTFTTVGGIPVLIAPEDMAAGVALSPQFTWAPAAGATSYGIQVAEDVGFAAPAVDASNIGGTSYSGAALAPMTTYYWRVRATGGQWTAPWSFTTNALIPDAPVLVSPLDGAAGVAVPVTLTWQPAANAERYSVQLAASPDMASPIVDNPDVSETELQVSSLAPGTAYYWRVAASNAAGTGPYSSIRSFTTQAAGALAVQFPSGTAGAGVTVSGTLPQGFSPGSATLFYKPIGAAAFDSVAMAVTGDQLNGMIPASSAGIRGLAAWVRVVSADGQTVLTNPSTEPSETPEYIRVSFDRFVYPRPFVLQQYSMVSIPAALSDPGAVPQLEDDYGEYDRRFWRALRWNGSSYDEYPALPAVQNANGWWMITQFGRGFDIEQGRSVDPVSEGRIVLPPGWSQIGSPYAFNVDWDSIPGASALMGPYRFDGTEYIPDNAVLAAWEGYFVLNPTAGIIVLNVAPRESAAAPGKTSALAGNAAFAMRISAFDPEGNWRDTYNTVGLASGTQESKTPEPPPIAASPRLSIVEGGAGYMGMVSLPGTEGNRWTLELKSDALGSEAVIALSMMGALPAGWSAILIDTYEGRRIEPAEKQFRVAGERTFIAAAGTDAYIARLMKEHTTIPREAGLGANYPNPFNPSTVIPFAVTDPAHVVIAVYDVHGRRIATLADGRYEPGRHTATWNAASGGAPLPAGTYLCRMTANGRTWTHALTLTK